MSPEASWPERIRWIARTFEDENLRALGRSIGVTGQAVSAWARGETRPSSQALAALAREYPELDCRWLLTGVGHPIDGNRGRTYDRAGPLRQDGPRGV